MVADKRTLADTQLLSIRNQLLIGEFPFKTSIDRGFRYAMFDCRMVAEMEALYHIGPCAGITSILHAGFASLHAVAGSLTQLPCGHQTWEWKPYKTIMFEDVWGPGHLHIDMRRLHRGIAHYQLRLLYQRAFYMTTPRGSSWMVHLHLHYQLWFLTIEGDGRSSSPQKKVPSFWGNVCRFESQWNLNRHGIAKMRYTHVVSSWDLCISNPWNGWAKEVKKIQLENT